MQIQFLKPALLLVLLLAAAAGHAADKPKEATFGKGKASGPIMTREQLRQCLSQQPQVQQQQAELAKQQAALGADKTEILRQGEVLKGELGALDSTQPDLVAAYNEKAEARDKAIDELQARLAQFNTRVEAANAQREAYVKACEGRNYFEDDEIAIRKGK